MPGGKYISGYVVVAILAMSTLLIGLCVAQKATPHPAPAHPAPAPQQHISRPQAQQQAQQKRHAGDWLRQYKDLPPEEQERALSNDPTFKKLPLARQQILRERLQHFSSLPPQRQIQILNRMDTWEHLTPEQKQEGRQV